MNRREAIRLAVKNCLAKGVMSGYLENHAEEVFNMLALEWNLDDALQACFADGVEDGIKNVTVKRKYANLRG